MGTWGLGDMGFRGQDIVQKTCTPLGLDMGTWGLGDMGTSLSWGHGFRGYGVEGDMGGEGDMGFRGHGTENIHLSWGHGV